MTDGSLAAIFVAPLGGRLADRLVHLNDLLAHVGELFIGQRGNHLAERTPTRLAGSSVPLP
jgi:hypothetical protein